MVNKINKKKRRDDGRKGIPQHRKGKVRKKEYKIIFVGQSGV